MPVSIGKPAPYLLEAAAHAVGREPSEAIMIGDVIATDLVGAQGRRRTLRVDADRGDDAGPRSRRCPPDEAPTAVAADAAELAEILERLATG